MTIQFATGFDHYTTITQRFSSTSGFTGGSNPLPSITTGGRNSSKCIQFSIGGSVSALTRRVIKTLPSTLTSAYAAFAFTANPINNKHFVIFNFLNLSTSHVRLVLLIDGRLQVQRGDATVLGTVSGDLALLENVYYHIEIRTTIDNSNGSVDLWLNEVLVLSVTGIDTQNGSTTDITEVALEQSPLGSLGGTTLFKFDDFIVSTSRIKDSEVTSYFPASVGDTDQWTAVGASTTALATDEVAPNSDTDYMSTSNSGDITLFNYGDISPTSEIIAIQVLPFAKKTDAGSATIAYAANIAGATYIGSDLAPSDSSYAYLPVLLTTSPATGITWTTSEWDNIQLGIKRTS